MTSLCDNTGLEDIARLSLGHVNCLIIDYVRVPGSKEMNLNPLTGME